MERTKQSIDLIGRAVKLCLPFADFPLPSLPMAPQGQDPSLVLDLSWADEEKKVSASFEDSLLHLSGPLGEARIDFEQARGKVDALRGFEARFLDCVLRHCATIFLHRSGGVLLHAAAVLTVEGAHVFAGPSGAGKSTLAELLEPHEVISDEFVFIEPGPRVLRSPPFGHAQRLSSPCAGFCLEGVSVLRKAEEFSWTALPRSVILSRLTVLSPLGFEPLEETQRIASLLRDVELLEFAFPSPEKVESSEVRGFVASRFSVGRRERTMAVVLDLSRERLARGEVVKVDVASESMDGAMTAGTEVTIEACPSKELSMGDVLLFTRCGELILHRLLLKRDGDYLTAGDNSSSFDAPLAEGDILGRAVENRSRQSSLASPAKALLTLLRLLTLAALRKLKQAVLACRQRRFHP